MKVPNKKRTYELMDELVSSTRYDEELPEEDYDEEGIPKDPDDTGEFLREPDEPSDTESIVLSSDKTDVSKAVIAAIKNRFK